MKELALKYVDFLVLTETKQDDSFPMSEFLVDGFLEPFRFDRNRSEGGVICSGRYLEYNFSQMISRVFL